MQYKKDKESSKLLLLVLLGLLIYLAFFGFDISGAYDFIVEQNLDIFRELKQ